MVIRSGIDLADESAEDMNNREINLLTKAALLGNAEALYYMNIHYDTGDIVNVDKDLAIFYSELAAEKNILMHYGDEGYVCFIKKGI